MQDQLSLFFAVSWRHVMPWASRRTFESQQEVIGKVKANSSFQKVKAKKAKKQKKK